MFARKKQYAVLKRNLLPYLPSPIENTLTIDIWNIISAFVFDGDKLRCPLTNEFFVEPVMINHAQYAPIIYERQAIEKYLPLLLPDDLPPLLVPVPIVKELVNFFLNRSKLDLLKLLTSLKQESVKSTNITQELARDIDVSPRRINEIVHGARSITADTDLRLSRALGTSEGFWLGLQADYDLEERKKEINKKLEKIKLLSHHAA